MEGPADYDRIRGDDRVSLVGHNAVAPGKPMHCVVEHEDAIEETINLRHSLNRNQIE